MSQVKEEKVEERDLLSDLQDVSDSERKTSSAESSSGECGPRRREVTAACGACLRSLPAVFF